MGNHSKISCVWEYLRPKCQKLISNKKSFTRKLDPEEIQNAFAYYYPISESTSLQLTNASLLRWYCREEYLEKQGQTIEKQFIIKKGVVRGYLLDSEGNEVTISFYTSGMAVTPTLMRSVDFVSFVNLQVISQEAEIYVFSNHIMDETMKGNGELMEFGFKVMMADSFLRAQRERMLLTYSGLERIEWFRLKFPKLENEIPHYYIASFLGMTPTSLSRLRKQKI